jgi:hypothetical protein
MANTEYYRMIKKITVAFGDLFSNITLVRYNPDESEQERFVVPMDYAAKELYVMRLQGDPNLDKKIMMALPRMSYELTGMSYDASRKQITNMKNFFKLPDGSTTYQYTPVPYDFNFSVYLYVRNIEDGNQIIEHILPFFAPDYTVKVNLIPELGIIKEVPVVLNTTTFDIDYEGDRTSDTRMIVWTLQFTVKGFIFGAQTDNSKIIYTSITNIYNDLHSNQNVLFNMNTGGTGNYQIGEVVYQGTTPALSYTNAKVVSWDRANTQLQVTNLVGNFVSNQPVIGVNSQANYTFNTFSVTPPLKSKIVATANGTTITEYK